MTSLERALSTLKEQIDETVPRTVRDGGATENRLRDLRAQNGRELPRNRLYGARRKPRERGESWRRGRPPNCAELQGFPMEFRLRLRLRQRIDEGRHEFPRRGQRDPTEPGAAPSGKRTGRLPPIPRECLPQAPPSGGCLRPR